MVIGLIPARGGSKSVPDKNIRLLNNKPLIGYAIECGLGSPSIDKLIVSTDSEKIAKIALEFGAEVPFMRPKNLAQDSSPMLPVIEHAILEIENADKTEVECIVLLDPTGPLRNIDDVENAMNIFRSEKCDLVASASIAHRSPHFNMVKKVDNYYALFSPSNISRRQDAPQVFDLNTVVWIYSRKAIMKEKARMPIKTMLYEIPSIRSIDIDTEFDLTLADFILSHHHNPSNA